MTNQENDWSLSGVSTQTNLKRKRMGTELSEAPSYAEGGEAILQVQIEEDPSENDWLKKVTSPPATSSEGVIREMESLIEKLEPDYDMVEQAQEPPLEQVQGQPPEQVHLPEGQVQWTGKQNRKKRPGKNTVYDPPSVKETRGGRIQMYSATGEKFQDNKLLNPQMWPEIAAVRVGRVPDRLPYRLWSASQLVERLKVSNQVAVSFNKVENRPGLRLHAVVRTYLHEDGLWAIIESVGDKTHDMPTPVCYLSAEGVHSIPDPNGFRRDKAQNKFPRVGDDRAALNVNMSGLYERAAMAKIPYGYRNTRMGEEKAALNANMSEIYEGAVVDGSLYGNRNSTVNAAQMPTYMGMQNHAWLMNMHPALIPQQKPAFPGGPQYTFPLPALPQGGGYHQMTAPPPALPQGGGYHQMSAPPPALSQGGGYHQMSAPPPPPLPMRRESDW